MSILRFSRKPIQDMALDLKDFWKLIKETPAPCYKLALLKDYADKTYKFKPQTIFRRYAKYRNQSSFNARTHQMLNRPCFVCEQKLVIRHHIIEVKHGGDNRKENLVSLCKECHSDIHPWLKKELAVA